MNYRQNYKHKTQVLRTRVHTWSASAILKISDYQVTVIVGGSDALTQSQWDGI